MTRSETAEREIATLKRLYDDHKLDDSLLVELDPLPGEPYFPDISVAMVGQDGNAGAVMGRVAEALRRSHVPAEAIDTFRASCMSGSYDELLQTAMRWVDVY